MTKTQRIERDTFIWKLSKDLGLTPTQIQQVLAVGKNYLTVRQIARIIKEKAKEQQS